ncbi:hypothetical protein K449DRAFT_432912 [Hypoxylon sp. EC38]|nr:hypothetical protein K449DRAFT_432912 [Hypoxylon sp. EC38]
MPRCSLETSPRIGYGTFDAPVPNCFPTSQNRDHRSFVVRDSPFVSESSLNPMLVASGWSHLTTDSREVLGNEFRIVTGRIDYSRNRLIYYSLGWAHRLAVDTTSSNRHPPPRSQSWKIQTRTACLIGDRTFVTLNMIITISDLRYESVFRANMSPVVCVSRTYTHKANKPWEGNKRVRNATYAMLSTQLNVPTGLGRHGLSIPLVVRNIDARARPSFVTA